MNHAGWVLLGLIIIWHLLTLNHLSKRINSLNEFIQFLFFHPLIYTNHREKFIVFLKEQAVQTNDYRFLWGACSKIVDNVAEKLHGEIVLANAVMRSDPSKIEQ